jgi:hypothetical protein
MIEQNIKGEKTKNFKDWGFELSPQLTKTDIFIN